MQPITVEIARQLTLAWDHFQPTAETGNPCSVRVTLHNASAIDLDSTPGEPLHLSYHWIDASTGEICIFEGKRTPISQPLPAGASRCFDLNVMAPDQPSQYRLQPTIVQDYVMWLDELATLPEPSPVITLRANHWWQPGQTDSIFSPHPILNRADYRQHLTHPTGFRPIALFCETVNLCNNACIICAYDQQTRPKGTMTMQLFDKVLTDYSTIGGGHLSLTPVVGDALLDRHLVARLRRCEDFPAITGISFTTNAAIAHLFDDEELEYILSRLRRINISVYGLNEDEYKTMTRRDTYSRLLQGIERILSFAKHEVVFAFRLLHRRQSHEVQSWVKQFPSYEACQAFVSIGEPVYSYSNWGIFDIAQPLPGDARWNELPAAKEQCLIPLIGCQVFWDGNVSFCPCDDFDQAESLHLGNLNQESLGQLYSGSRARLLWDWKTNGVPRFCQTCSFYSPLSMLPPGTELFKDPLLLAGA